MSPDRDAGRPNPSRAFPGAVLVLFSLLGGPAIAGDAEDLERLLDNFLADVDSVAMHEQFWADDLVYTSSNGTRTNKAAILDDMRSAEAATDEAGVRYRADDVDIRLYGDTAIVAFRLVATPAGDAGESTEYFNTGTFLRRDGRWQAIAWQATRIP